jgi:hypothetical protein
MILDNTLVLSDKQAITATAASTNVIDRGAAGTVFGAAAALSVDIGKENEIPLQVSVTEAFNNLTSLKIALETSADNSTFTEVASRTYLLASINATGQLNFPACILEGTNQRYIRLNYTVTGTAPTTGKIFAGVVAARQTH